MNHGPDTPLDWSSFVGAVARLAERSPDEIGPRTRIIEDLDLDSLSLTELFVLLADHGDERAIAERMTEGWEGVTVEQLFQQYTATR